jgi:N-acetylglucosamine-6-sulfatase
MPLVMCWPARIPAGVRVAQLVQNIDYAPTFLEAAGVTPPCEIQGDSLLALFDSNTPDWRDALYYHYYEKGEHNVPPHDGVRTSRHKLIHFYEQNDWELIDLDKDPRELRDVWDDPAYADVRAEILGRYQALRKQFDVPPTAPQPPSQPAPTKNP